MCREIYYQNQRRPEPAHDFSNMNYDSCTKESANMHNFLKVNSHGSKVTETVTGCSYFIPLLIQL